MENARVPLPTDLVGGRAHKRPVVLVVEGCVGEHAPGSVDRHHTGLGHADEVSGVVERPSGLTRIKLNCLFE